jgi:hypothetical protein
MSVQFVLTREVLEKILPMNIRQYVQSLGFIKDNSITGKISVYHKDNYELIVPQDTRLGDYTNRIADIVLKLSEITNHKPNQIINELLIPPSDILKFSLKGQSTENGTVSLTEGISLLSSSKKAILSAACQVIDPQKYHKRLQRGDAESFLSSCRMGQTEYGSFVVTVSCPLNAGTQIILPGVTEQPFARKVTTSLIKSIHEVVSAIDADDLARITSPEANSIITSANLCDALLEMQPSDNAGELIIASIWSKQVAFTDTFPSSVAIRKDYFSQIEQVAKSLRPTLESRSEDFIARVDSLHGSLDAEGRMYGDVGLVFLHDDEELIKARVNLSHESYALACDAHKVGKYIFIKGNLVRWNRVSRINDYSGFHILSEMN